MNRIAIVTLILLAVAGCSKESAKTPAAAETTTLSPEQAGSATGASEPLSAFTLAHPTTMASAFGGVCYVDSKSGLRCFDSSDGCIAEPPKGKFASISGTEEYACGLAADGEISCWGPGGPEVLEIRQARQVSVQKPHSCALAADGSMQCWGRDFEGSLEVPEGKFTQVAVGHHHTCALREDKSIACWGWNTSKQTAAPAGEYVFVTSGLQRSCAIDAEGKIVCWGDNTDSPPGSFTQVALGSSRTCALRSDGEAVCWGYRIEGFATMSGGPFIEVSEECARTATGNIECFAPGSANNVDDGSSRYPDASGSCGPPTAPPDEAVVVRRPWIDDAMKLVRANDFEAIESARDQVTKADIPAFVEEYFKLTEWEDKTSLVDLLQDHHEAAMNPMMRDALAVPDCEYDSCWATRAVALSYFDGDFDKFMTYFSDHKLAKQRIEERLAEFK
tara:strand:- start:37114 stop:38454 length:1341 start_codon:yes stop_codon:yes gene_type:complete